MQNQNSKAECKTKIQKQNQRFKVRPNAKPKFKVRPNAKPKFKVRPNAKPKFKK
jgi:hypothetical protein